MTAIVTQGDAAALQLPDESVDLVVTSPPYFGLRSYQDGGEHYAGQIGAEPTPTAYLDALLACTAEWMRVLKPGGSIFVNLGDKYSGYNVNGAAGRSLRGSEQRAERRVQGGRNPADYGIPNKSLMMLPQRYAIRAVDELGLILRAEIIWAKPNGLPESVTDRVRRSHEQVFHFVKQPRYYAAVDSIREPHSEHTLRYYSAPGQTTTPGLGGRQGETHAHRAGGGKSGPNAGLVSNPLGKLPGSVWSIPTAPLRVPAELGIDHFAAYPPELVRRIVLGWSPRDVCTACGEGRRPVVELGDLVPSVSDPARARLRSDVTVSNVRAGNAGRQDGATQRLSAAGGHTLPKRERTLTGYACACPDTAAPTTPGVVLDPFGGTGTTALVASVHGRVGISVDLSADYCRLARWRTEDPGQRAKAAGTKLKAPRKPKPQPVADVIPFEVAGQLDLMAEGEWTA